MGKKGAHDQTTGTPVTTFTVNSKLYAANAKSDRDKDGIACEKRYPRSGAVVILS